LNETGGGAARKNLTGQSLMPHSRHHISLKLLIAISVITSICGCSVFEFLGGEPRASGTILTNNSVSTKKALECVGSTIMKFHGTTSSWMINVTRKDEATGVLETGSFDQSNVMGFRVRAMHIREQNLITLKLKGAGPYYADLGVIQGMEELKSGVQSCL
jgi:hypothetical protein